MPTRRNQARTNIVLTGFMGTGKTTVGQVTATLSDREFVDTDAIIEARHGPIPTIFTDHGEQAFRRLERDVAAELAARSNLVIATGGRMLLDSENRRAFEATGVVICLTADPEVLLERLVADGVEGRPLLAGDDPAAAIERLLAERRPGYSTFPQVATDNRTPEEVAAEVLAIADGAG